MGAKVVFVMTGTGRDWRFVNDEFLEGIEKYTSTIGRSIYGNSYLSKPHYLSLGAVWQFISYDDFYGWMELLSKNEDFLDLDGKMRIGLSNTNTSKRRKAINILRELDNDDLKEISEIFIEEYEEEGKEIIEEHILINIKELYNIETRIREENEEKKGSLKEKLIKCWRG